MSRYTAFGSNTWDWEPLVQCTEPTRLVWVVLWTNARSKSLVPGLFYGGPSALAEEGKLAADTTQAGITELMDRELLEWDRRTRVMRMTRLPDAAERPHSWKVLSSWWTQFKGVPACPVRDAHVELIRWLADGAGERPMSDASLRFWDQTFATIRIPRRRGRLGTSGETLSPQGSLFDSGGLGYPIGYPIRYDQDQDQDLDLDLRSGEVEVAAPAPPAPETPRPVARPVLTVVEGDEGSAPFTIEQLFDTLTRSSGGRFVSDPFDRRLARPISAVIRECHAQAIGIADIEVVGRWLADGGLSFREDLGPTWCSKTGNLLDAVAQARRWDAARPSPPAPPDPTTTPRAAGGRRKLT